MPSNVSRTIIAASNKGFVNAFRGAQKVAAGFAVAMRGVGTSVSASFAPVIAALAPIVGGAAFAAGTKNVLDLGGRLSDVASRTGDTVKSLTILEQQLKDNGGSAEELGDHFNKMQDSLATKTGIAALKEMGFSLADLGRMAPSEQFVAIGKALNGIDDAAKRTQAARDIFGKSGGKLLTLFSDPSFGKGSANLQKQAVVLEKNAAIFDSVSDKLARTGNVMRGFFLGVAEKIAPSLDGILDKIEKIDLIEIGRQFGDLIVNSGNVFAGIVKSIGPASEAIGLALAEAFARAGNTLYNSFQAAMELFPALGEMLGSRDFWTGMLNAFIGTANLMAASLLDAFSGPLKEINDRFTYLSERVLAGVGGESKIPAAEMLDKEIKRLETLRDKHLADAEANPTNAPEARRRAAGVNSLLSDVLQQRADLGFVPRSFEQIQEQDPAPFAAASKGLKQTAANFFDQAGNSLNPFVNRFAQILEKHNEDYFGAAQLQAQSQAKFAESLKGWESGVKTFTPGVTEQPAPPMAQPTWFEQRLRENGQGLIGANANWTKGLSTSGLSTSGLIDGNNAMATLRRPGESIGEYRQRVSESKKEQETKKMSAAEARQKEREAEAEATRETAKNTSRILSVMEEAWV